VSAAFPGRLRLRTVRARVTAAAAVSILLSVTLLGATTAVLVGHRLRSSLDRALVQRATEISRVAVSAPALLTLPGTLEAPQGGRQLAVEVLDRHARIVARSAALGGRVLPADPLLDRALGQGRSGYADQTLSGDHVRVYAAPLANEGGPASGGAVLLAASTGEIRDTLSALTDLIGLSALAAAALGAAAAAMLTARGLRPLGILSRAAGQIERTRDPGLRLPERAGEGELGELTATLNRMLGALESARDTERRFLADASHELRTPLTSLRGNAAYVARHGADPEALADLEQDAARLGRLLDDLLALEREQGARATGELVSLDELLAEAVAGHERVHVGASVPVGVMGQRGALRRALENLLANAEIHGPPGGTVTVELVHVDGRARLSVTDEGPGPRAQDAQRAFSRFWRGEEAAQRPGSGLGLAIVRATAERHGGSVALAGSRFTLDLPAV